MLHIIGTQFHFRATSVRCVRQPVDRQTQIRQYIVVNDIVEENRVRIERIFSQDDAICECLLSTDGCGLSGSDSNCSQPWTRVL